LEGLKAPRRSRHPDAPGRGVVSVRVVIWLARSRMARTIAAGLVCVALAVPILAASGAAVLVGAGGGGCGGLPAEASGPVAVGMFAAPLRMARGRWYEVGATAYGGPGDPSSGDYGAIPDPGQSYLPSHPDSFAELSVLDSNPANGGSFTFADADALGNLPYLTAVRVEHGGRSLVVQKRDIGYGQGLGQAIGNGEPYRLDLWWQAAQRLGVSKSAVRIERAPSGGAVGVDERVRLASASAPAMPRGRVCHNSPERFERGYAATAVGAASWRGPRSSTMPPWVVMPSVRDGCRADLVDDPAHGLEECVQGGLRL